MKTAFVWGEFVLVLLLGESIRPYVYLLIPTIFASCLTGFVWFLGMVLIIMRQTKALIVGAAVGFAVSAVLSVVMIPEFIFDGPILV